jgi:hypothetical protein
MNGFPERPGLNPDPLEEWDGDPNAEDRIEEQERIDRLELHMSCDCPERHIMIHAFACHLRQSVVEIANDDAWARLHRGSGGA